MRIGQCQAGASHRIVVIVLAIDLLVVILRPRMPLTEKIYAVGVRKTRITSVRNAREGQREKIETLVLRDARKARNVRS